MNCGASVESNEIGSGKAWNARDIAIPDVMPQAAASEMFAALWVTHHSGGLNPLYAKVIQDAIALAEGHPDYFVDWMKLRDYINEDNLPAARVRVPIYNGKVDIVEFNTSEVMERAAWVHKTLIEKLKP